MPVRRRTAAGSGGRPDPAVELGVAGETFLDTGHADEDQAEPAAVVAVAELFEWLESPVVGLVDDEQFDELGAAVRDFETPPIERAGYVERRPDPADGRARLVRVAERGARSVEASRGIVAQVEAEWTAYLGARRMAQLRRILTDLREITDPWR